MFQLEMNRILKTNMFKIKGRKAKRPKRFFCERYPWTYDDVVYFNYLMGKSGGDISTCIDAISFHMMSFAPDWNLKMRSYAYYRRVDGEVVPKLSEKLSMKIYKQLKPEFKSRIEDILYDYHLLGIPFEEYPRVYYAMCAFEIFPVLHVNTTFTTNELVEINSAITDNLIIVCKNNVIIRFYKGYYKTWTLNKANQKLIIPILSCIVCCKKDSTADRLINKVINDYREEMETLVNQIL